MNFFDPQYNKGPMVAAHRGYRAIRPENTLCAFEAALGCCHYIELDVQMSRDGIPVIIHDERLGRTCTLPELEDGTGGELPRTDSLDYSTLVQLDYGSWFIEDDPFQTIREGLVDKEELQPLIPQQLLTLRELLKWRNRVDIPLNIEIKDQEGGRHDQIIVEAVLQEISKAGCAESVIISSFNHEYLRQISAIMPAIFLGALQEDHHPDNICKYLQSLGANAYHPDKTLVTKELLTELRSAGFAVHIFTVNDKKQQNLFLQQGASSVITDFPCNVFSFLAEKRSLS